MAIFYGNTAGEPSRFWEGSPADFCLDRGDFGLQGNRHRSRYRTGEKPVSPRLKGCHDRNEAQLIYLK